MTGLISPEEFARRYRPLFETNTLAFTIVMSDERMKRLVIAWPVVRRKFRPGNASTMSDVWKLVEFSQREWAEKAGVPYYDLRDEDFTFLKENGLVFPDGTIPEDLRHMLVVEVRGLRLSYAQQGLEQQRMFDALRGAGDASRAVQEGDQS